MRYQNEINRMTNLTNFIRNSFGSGINPSKAKQKDVYAEKLKSSELKGIYETAKETFAPVPYSKENKPYYLFSKFFAVFYHIISFSFALVTVGLLAVVGSGLQSTKPDIPEALLYALAVLFAVVGLVALIGIETFKGLSSQSIFKNLAYNRKVKPLAVVSLVVLAFFSILFSSVGGGVLSFYLSDNSKEITANFEAQKDSIKTLYSNRLEEQNQIITSYSELEKSRKARSKAWGLDGTETAVKQGAINRKIELENQLTKELKELKNAQKSAITANLEGGKYSGFLSGGIILLLELFALLAYRYKFIYLAKCELEGVNFSVITVNSKPSEPTPQPQNAQNELVNNLAYALNQLAYNGNSVNTPTAKAGNVGFQFGVSNDNSVNNGNNVVHAKGKDATNSVKTPKNAKVGICKNCGSKYTYIRSTKKFCSKVCRVEHWENANGKKLKSYKKK